MSNDIQTDYCLVDAGITGVLKVFLPGLFEKAQKPGARIMKNGTCLTYAASGCFSTI